MHEVLVWWGGRCGYSCDDDEGNRRQLPPRVILTTEVSPFRLLGEQPAPPLHPLFSSETTSLMKWEYIKFWNLVRKFRRYSLPLPLSASLLLRRNVESAAPRHRGAPGSAMHLQTSTHQSLRFFTSRWHRQVPSRLPCLERSAEEEWRPWTLGLWGVSQAAPGCPASV